MAATVRAVGEGGRGPAGATPPALGPAARPPRGAGARWPTASGGRRAPAGGFYMLGGVEGRVWGGWANRSQGGARRGEVGGRGQALRCRRGRPVHPGTGWGSCRRGLTALPSDAKPPVPFLFRTPRTSHPQDSVPATAAESSVFHPAKWGEPPFFAFQGFLILFKPFSRVHL